MTYWRRGEERQRPVRPDLFMPSTNAGKEISPPCQACGGKERRGGGFTHDTSFSGKGRLCRCKEGGEAKKVLDC